ncbi:S-methyl-5'-thioadenosine phosphorylase [Draconibacterium sp. IB214405]|uniref:S-methyl-5'-thioadenosine phosphorylase n=1 Tax=Draconibacterium sp. IB214405 TaxID=3097352 RepID=UPI002A16C92B|nr:S-methyl-5'-thioadenosine phosphorylase [Draconibacterium sp. IB214405]MDX8341605.1 S-methyl-5'-thioadenosine phosphorylase [Draconibacterium sp. IB214405]
MIKIAIIGGSGLEDPAILKEAKEVAVDTPYGAPSSTFKCGKIGDVDVAILSRHGRDHSIPPTKVNNRANIWAIRELGCTHIFATTACGSLRLEIGRGDIVFPHQFIDFTRFRKSTFVEDFEDGNLDHPAMPEPFSWNMRQMLIEQAKELNLGYHKTGTVITIEGPRFSTRAESNMFRIWGADIINMSTAPECALANELQIPYAAIALSTDYDSWNVDEAPVTWEEVLKVFNENVENVIKLLENTIAEFNK